MALIHSIYIFNSTLIYQYTLIYLYVWLIYFNIISKKTDFPSCPFWLKVYVMNGHCSYWLINLINDGPLDYLSTKTFGQVENIYIIGQDGQWVYSQIRHLVKLDKEKWHHTHIGTYYNTYLTMYLLWYLPT
jgi:hypothetical protein